jgi:hypothetical protein
VIWYGSSYYDESVVEKDGLPKKQRHHSERHNLHEKLSKERARNRYNNLISRKLYMLLLKRTNNYRILRDIVEDCVGMADSQGPAPIENQVSKFLAKKLEEHQSLHEGPQIPQELLTTDYASSSDGESLSQAQRPQRKLAPLSHPGISVNESKIMPNDFTRPIEPLAALRPTSGSSQKSKQFKDVQSWVKKINKRPRSAPKEHTPVVVVKATSVAKITIDTLPTLVKTRENTASKALPNGTVKRNRPKSAPVQDFGLAPC